VANPNTNPNPYPGLILDNAAQTTCQRDTHSWWSNSPSLRNWHRPSTVIDTSKAPPSIRPTLAGLGRVLGRFINDTWLAPAGPGRFIGLFGRVFSGWARF